MGKTCLIVGCVARGGRDPRSFFRLPAVIENQCEKTKTLSTQRRLLWLNRISRADLGGLNLTHARVCSAHFLTGKPAQLFDSDNPDWAPSVSLGHTKVKLAKKASAVRKVRIQRRSKKRRMYEAAESLLQMSQCLGPPDESGIEPLSDDDPPTDEPNTIQCQTDITLPLMDGMQCEIKCLTQENMDLRKSVQNSTYSEETFKGDNERVKCYTGLPDFTLLMLVFKFISDDMSYAANSCLSKFQQMILTLMRLRLNLSIQDIAYRFNISCPTASRIFVAVINIMYHNLGWLVKWPTRYVLIESTPTDFRKQYGVHVSAIIDCFEVFTDRPTGLMPQAQTRSNNKHHNTVKFLMAICPQGSVTYISKAWGGHVSDKYITENSGFLNHILPGDIILADRGFDIKDSVGAMQAAVTITAFIKGEKRLSMAEFIETRKIAHLRIHVERVIDCIKQRYSMVGGPVPLDYVQNLDQDGLTVLDKITKVCCSLYNLGDGIVSFH
ncbi:uncharacterized protein LOC124868593 [Girardinichthys multiradiatus]|uniref:uncharacterized protein LOC124868593 n=1 Tax=Girardinichthys multiradiatus TaxID=208333 RepID=UPI001FAD8D05|nr:uncharacterized protein LOC124868593 [Girardinichthys multiradiatus]